MRFDQGTNVVFVRGFRIIFQLHRGVWKIGLHFNFYTVWIFYCNFYIIIMCSILRETFYIIRCNDNKIDWITCMSTRCDARTLANCQYCSSPDGCCCCCGSPPPLITGGAVEPAGEATLNRATLNRATVKRWQFTRRHLTGATINQAPLHRATLHRAGSRPPVSLLYTWTTNHHANTI